VGVVTGSLGKGCRIDVSTERTPEVRVLRILVHVILVVRRRNNKSIIVQKLSGED
jgi:hypothetical protein